MFVEYYRADPSFYPADPAPSALNNRDEPELPAAAKWRRIDIGAFGNTLYVSRICEAAPNKASAADLLQ
jgi:hypothetical protein